MITDLQKNIDDTPEIQVLIGLVKHFLEHATFFGINRKELLSQGGLTEDQLGDSNQCIPLNYFEKMISYTYNVCNNPLVSLSFSKKMDSTAYGVLGHLVPLSSTLSTAIYTLKEYQPLIGCIGDISIQIKSDIIYWKWKCKSKDPIFIRCGTEYNLAWWVSLVKLVRDEGHPVLKAVHFTHTLATPELQKMYDEFFGCPVYFDQKEAALLLLPQSLDMTLKTANLGLYDSVKIFAQKLLEQQKVEQTFTEQVRAQIYLLLHQQRLSRENVAEQLAVNVRTLSRKLLQEKSAYSKILDQVRFDLAQNYLVNYQHSVVFISKALGFYTSHSFITWFRLQTNLTPTQYRKISNNSELY